MEFRVLGPLEVRVGGQARSVGGAKQRTLMLALLLRRGEVVTIDRLIEDVWGGKRGTAAARSVQVYVSELRKALGDAARIRGEAGGYLLVAAADEVDAWRFEQLVDDGRRLRMGGEPQAARACLDDALALWRGRPFAEAEYEPFAAPEVARMEELRLVAVEERIETDLALGRHVEILPELEAAVAEHALRERLRGQLMLALYRCGRQADALAAYQAARRTLLDELGLEPARALKELEAAILRQDDSLDVESAELSARRRLPAPITPLIGRRQEVGEVVELIRGGARLVTLTGPGGTGKTRVALRAAHELAQRFAGGVFFVGLAGVRDARFVPAAVAGAVDIEGVEDLAGLAERLRDRPTLLLLDNFEQVDEAAGLLGGFLSAAPAVALLVTSRHPLRIYGEHEYRVPPLRLDEEAVPLFVERARAAGAELGSSVAVTEICRRLDRLPLAIELAAGRARDLPPRQMLAELPGALSLASAGPRDAPARQRTLRATIEWSHDLLAPDEREAFALAGVFAGGWDAEAATACGVSIEALRALVTRSLVTQREGRFSMLETTREFALERLAESGRLEEMRARCAAHYVDLAERANTALRAGGGQAEWLGRLDAEHDNLRAALDWLADRDTPDDLRLVGALAAFWAVRGHAAEGLIRIERALARERPVDAVPIDRARGLVGGSVLAWVVGDLERSRGWAEEGLTIYREAGHGSGMVRALANLGFVASESGDNTAARRFYEEGVTVARRAGTPRDVAIATGGLCELALKARDLDEARRLGEEQLVIGREARDDESVGVALINLGHAAVLSDRLDPAVELLAEAVDVFRRLGDGVSLSYCLDGFAAVAVRRGQAEAAARLLGAAHGQRELAGAPAAFEGELRDETAARTRQALGARAYAEARTAGTALGLDGALALARGSNRAGARSRAPRTTSAASA